MLKTITLTLFSAFAAITSALADPTLDIYFDATNGNGKSQEKLKTLDDSAPITATFHFEVKDMDSWTMTYEWRFCHEGGTLDDPYMIRYESDPQVTFTEAGTDSIALYVTFTNGQQTLELKRDYWKKSGDVAREGEGIILTIKASESDLTFPNAFSPNGDGKNDTYKPKTYQSIVEFRGIIFSRWGQKLYEWDNVAADGWDGTYNGKPVKQGVYYALIRAKGADGRKFELKKDVNLLRTYDETISESDTK